MIIIETDRIYSVYVRKSRYVAWKYAEYCGRYETVEQAINAVKERFEEEPVEYLIQTLNCEIVAQGFIK